MLEAGERGGRVKQFALKLLHVKPQRLAVHVSVQIEYASPLIQIDGDTEKIAFRIRRSHTINRRGYLLST